MYPPHHHVETDIEKSFRVIEEFKFATMIHPAEGDVVVTQIPLILKRERGKHGVLVGHIDRNNPHVPYLDGQRAFVIFHGPNSYISPSVYATSQLPTWNSISVHVRGRTSLVKSSSALRESIIEMTEILEGEEQKFILQSYDSRMNSWLHLIVGFEIEIEEIVGRFKLSQDKSEQDMMLAKDHLSAMSTRRHDSLFDELLNISN